MRPGVTRIIVVACLATAPARAESAAPTPSSEHPVRFRADRLELEPQPEGDRLRLEGDVVVTASRYRLSGEKLELRRTGRGIVVDGAGRVALCPCPDPPVSFGFQSALVAPPTDLLLEQPTLRVGPVPVAWMPYLWLRSRARLGALPPTIAWRGPDGLLAGSGVHVPLDRPGDAYLDVRAAGYLEGGVDVETRLDTRTTTSRVRWDHLNEDLLDVDMRGAVEEPASAVIAWNVDALRGSRTATGPLLIEDAARRMDRAEVSAGSSSGGWTAGVLARADANRGGDLDVSGALGPGLLVGASGPIGRVGSAEGAIAMRTSHSEQSGTVTQAREETAMRFDARPSIFGVEAELRSRAITSIEAVSSPAAAAGGFQLATTLPLVRKFGAFSHYVTPRADAGLTLAERDGSPVTPFLFGDGLTANAALGFDTTFGSYVRREGARLVVRAGAVGEPDAMSRAAKARAVAWTDLVAASVDGGILRDSVVTTAFAVRARFGAVDGLSVHGGLSGQSAPAADLGLLDGGGWEAVSVPWFDRAGWSTDAGLQVPWTIWLASAADVDYDVTHRTLLGVRGATGYRHPCGCIAVIGSGRHRVGRQGFDASVTVDLVP